jgi:general secretion pathway protein G
VRGAAKASDPRAGLTIVELLISMAVLAVVAAIVVVIYAGTLVKARNTRAISEIRTLEKEIATFELDEDGLPNSLLEVRRNGLKDPWGNPYQYLRLRGRGRGRGRGGPPPQAARTFHGPINKLYDLFSMGEDERSQPPLTAPVSHDDIVRADEGAFVGLAWEYTAP